MKLEPVVGIVLILIISVFVTGCENDNDNPQTTLKTHTSYTPYSLLDEYLTHLGTQERKEFWRVCQHEGLQRAVDTLDVPAAAVFTDRFSATGRNTPHGRLLEKHYRNYQNRSRLILQILHDICHNYNIDVPNTVVLESDKDRYIVLMPGENSASDKKPEKPSK